MSKTPASTPPSSGPRPAILSTQLQPPQTFSDGLPVPKLLVFDLDYTLWPFWVDTHVTPPLKAKAGPGGSASASVDRCGETFAFYPTVPPLLLSLAALPSPPLLSLASRTSAPDLAITLLKQIQLLRPAPPPPSSALSPSSSTLSPSSSTLSPSSSTLSPLSSTATTSSTRAPASKRALDFFAHAQVYPGDKRAHFAKLHKLSGVAYDEMLFFDDERRNRNVEALGVVMRLVVNGVSALEVDEGVREWRSRKGRGGGRR